MQQQSSSSSSNRFREHDFCWKTKYSVVECKASENVCENLLDVLGQSETYFLPSGWKLENDQLKFSSRLPLRNIHHLPVRGPRATQFQFFYHRFTHSSLQLESRIQGAQDRSLRGSVGFWAPPRPLEERAHARDQNVHQCSARKVWQLAPQLEASFFVQDRRWLWPPRQQDSVVSFSFIAALQVSGWG